MASLCAGKQGGRIKYRMLGKDLTVSGGLKIVKE